MKRSKKNLTINCLGAALLSSAALTTSSANVFDSSELDSPYSNAKECELRPEGRCGEGKCGGNPAPEGKCGEGKCGATPVPEGKCGEGKCGTDRERQDCND